MSVLGARTLEARTLEARQSRCYTDIYGRRRCRNNAWNGWARWLVLGLVIAAVILLFMSFACVSARRRRKMGNQPFRGTGWAVGNKPWGNNPQPSYNNNAQPYYANNNNNNTAPPPAYQPPANQSYYGGQQSGTELQQPQQSYQSYRSTEGQYEPPKGPPPGRQ